jgi:fumarylpyruvate hydrolase
MGGDPDREPPFFFSKPADAVVQCGVSEQEQEEQTKSPILTEIPYPSHTNDLHHEVELVVALGKDVDTGSDDPEHLFDCVYGYTVGVDLTRRDLQAEAKKKGRPWCSSKGFDSSAPVGTLHPVSTISPSTSIWLDVNGQRRQNSNLQQMTWSVPEIIAHLSKQFLLKAGDLIFTGTPGGVSALRPGDVVIAGIDGVGQLAFRITERKLELVTS